ncbi:MAG TPA: hypothetical protein VJH21_00340 [Candidatus Paceibacterota bacterium]
MLFRPKTLKTGKLARRKRRVFLFKLLGALFLLGLLLSVIIYALHRPELLIKQITVSGTSSLQSEEIKQFVEDRISGEYVYLIPRASVFFYPKHSLQEELLSSFKPMRTVSFTQETLGSLLVSIEEREPSALWCGENRLDDVTPECYFLDEDGFIYINAPIFSDNVYIRFYGPLKNGYPIGQLFLEPSVYRSLTLFILSLKEEDILVADFAVLDSDDFELYLKNGIQILFGRNQELSTVFDNIRAVFLSDEFKEMDFSTVDYIDLRFGNKVFYKLRE